ncbi:MAG: aminotransferase class I/II-fold pyridoxal phosphate-dependent enzyme [Deltaproteobacteria bacterium]|nr:aminotransferase class I/II-fold pyridoxal phosphate-dependent enzyme [Deltaproteobacteria bacterium]
MAIRNADTLLIHEGEPRPRIGRAITVPIFQASTFEVLEGSSAGYYDLKYARLSNTPSHDVLHEKLAALEGAEAALVTGSGMAAISTALLTVLRPGDHALFSRCLYGGTDDFVTQELADFGVAASHLDVSNPSSWANELRPNTKLIYVEVMTNPSLEVGALDEVPRFAKANGLTSFIDNTFATPLGYRPIEVGYDVSLHSATKYLNGHSDIVAGTIMGSAAFIKRVRRRLAHLGGVLDPHACFLLHRGLKTLGVRFRHQCKSAERIAAEMAQWPEVACVLHPSLESHPSHVRAKTQLRAFGAVLSFRPTGGVDAAKRFLARVELPLSAPSLGGVESLVTRPVTTSHRGLSAEARVRAGVTEDLVRVSVGLEDPDDLLQDFRRALSES